MSEHRTYWLTVGTTLLAVGGGGVIALETTELSGKVWGGWLLWICVAMVIAGLAILVAVLVGASRAARQAQQAADVRKAAREQIRMCLDEGWKRVNHNLDGDREWVEKTEAVLRQHLDESFVARYVAAGARTQENSHPGYVLPRVECLQTILDDL